MRSGRIWRRLTSQVSEMAEPKEADLPTSLLRERQVMCRMRTEEGATYGYSS